MSLRNKAPLIGATYRGLCGTLHTNFVLLDIFEGNLLPYVLQDLGTQLSPKAYMTASKRVPPINLMKRVIDKLSTIYAKPPTREVTGSDQDDATWDWYVEKFSLDVEMQLANEYFNMHKACALEPYMDRNYLPRMRVIPYDRFFVMATDPSDPLYMTEFVKVMGKRMRTYTEGKDTITKEKVILYAYSDEEFLIVDEDGSVCEEIMAELQSIDASIDGSNQYGAIPFVYINRSKTKVNPTDDTDLLAMTKLVPIMITDINYAMMFQSFSLFYTIDVESEKHEMNPNAWINLKSDKESGKEPKIGTIKPELDIAESFVAIKEEIGLWLQSRNIRPGASGQGGNELSVSGISKMVDEIDTTSERNKTIPFFQGAEIGLFNLVTKHLHPSWILNPSFESEYKTPFTNGVTESVSFSEQIVTKSRKEILDETVIELVNKIVSRKEAIKRVNPEWSDEQVQEEMDRIDGKDPNNEGIDQKGELSSQQAIQQSALNGAQLASLIDVVAKVQAGEVPREAAKNIILNSFPFIDPAEADKILSGVKVVKASNVNSTPKV